MKVSLNNFCLSLGVAILVCFLCLKAQADPLALEVYPSPEAADAICPQEIVVIEDAKAFSGKFTVDGRAELKAFAGPFAIVNKDAFSVTWEAKLNPQYRQCKATAGLSNNGQYLSYLRMRFIDGKVLLILDMTGLRDVNRFTPTIFSQDVKNGNPVWQWGGTD